MSAAHKQPINRKVLYLLLIAIAVMGVAGVLVVMVNDPRDAARERQGERDQAEVERMQAGSVEAGQSQVEEMRRAAERRTSSRPPEDDPDRLAFEMFQRGELPGQAAVPGAPGHPELDPELLKQLDLAHQEVGRRPDLDRAFGDAPLVPTMQDGGTYGEPKSTAIRYENFSPADDVGEGLFGSIGGEGDDVSDALRPERAPSERVVNQGVSIPAVLMSRIDTRIQGPITARVTRTIYDSRTHHIPLIPQGSQLVGSYGSNVDGGSDRIEVVMERLILPDGRSIRLPQFPVAGSDGTMGTTGTYKSNILRAIGPTFIVSVLGQVADRQINRQLPSEDPSGPFGPGQQPPSVLQQTMPKVNEAVMERGQGARPYFVVDPGQEIRVVLTDDIEIPAAGGRG